MPRIAYETALFREDFRRASRQVQGKIEAFLRKFDEDADRAGMRLKTPKTAADGRVKTARVDQGLRAVLVDLGKDEYVLVRVMEHDAAYDWATTLRPDVSTFDGRPRLLNVAFADALQADQPAPQQHNLFSHRNDGDFDTLGVPAFLVPALRAMPSAREAIQLADHMGESDPLLGFAIHGLLEPDKSVDDVFAELVSLEGGPAADAPRDDGVLSGTDDAIAEPRAFDAENLTAALSRPGADERFRVVEDSEELVNALQGDFADWRVFLHPLQHKAAYSTSFTGPARVSGGAGTGKTIVLIHRAKALLDRGDGEHAPRILLTTFTKPLQGDLIGLRDQLLGEEQASLIDVRTVDGLARELHRRMTGADVTELSTEEERRLWQDIAQSLNFGRSATFLEAEYRHVILAQGVRSLDDYLAVRRTGRGVRLSSESRSELWPAFERFEATTRQAGRFSTLQLTEAVAALLEQLPAGLYDHVLVDEAQDLHASQWRLLRAITTPGPDDLFIAGDAFQRIYGNTVSLRSLGIETRGRSQRLRRNYRTTHEIIGWALGIVGDETVVDLDELGADLGGYHSVRHGPTPTFTAFANREDELAGLTQTIEGWLRAGHGAQDIAVTARTRGELPGIITALQRAGISAGQMGRNGRLHDMVNVTTMHRVKGLEFPCVAIIGLSHDSVPPPGEVCPVEDDAKQHAEDLQTERSLIYVAATRARDELSVSWTGEPTTLIEQPLNTMITATPDTTGDASWKP